MNDTQPPPKPSTGDVWLELIEHERDETLVTLYAARRELGIERYDTPLQRDNGRDTFVDCQDEILDGMVYAKSLRRDDVVLQLRGALVMLLRPGDSDDPLPKGTAFQHGGILIQVTSEPLGDRGLQTVKLTSGAGVTGDMITPWRDIVRWFRNRDKLKAPPAPNAQADRS